MYSLYTSSPVLQTVSLTLTQILKRWVNVYLSLNLTHYRTARTEIIIILTAEVMYNTNGDKSEVACRNNLETAYLWIIETAKTTDLCV